MSYDWDGVDDFMVAAGAATLGPAFSACAWFNADTEGESNGGTVLGHSTGVELERWKIHWNTSGMRKLSLAARFSTNWGAWDMSWGFPSSLTGWKWVMVTWTVGLATPPTLYYWDPIDWIMEMSIGNGGLVVRSVPSGTAPADGGNIDIGSNYGQGYVFDGRIAEVAVWTRVLTTAEACAVHTRGVRAISNGLYLYQPLANFGDLRDYSGNGRHVASVSGPVWHGSMPPTYPMGVSPVAGQARLRTVVAPVEDLMIVPAGRLDWAPTGNTVNFHPYNGNKLPINGVNVTIPPSGVTLDRTGLTANTNYYIYAYLNAGNMALEASTTGHSTDATTGIEIKTGDPTRSLVGLGRHYSGGFSNGSYWRSVLSWYNRQPLGLSAYYTTSRPITSVGTWVEVHAEIRCEFPTWADEAISLHWHGSITNDTAGAATYTALGFVPTAEGAISLHNLNVAGYWIPHTISLVTTRAESGYYYATVFGYVGSASTANFHPWGALTATIRG